MPSMSSISSITTIEERALIQMDQKKRHKFKHELQFWAFDKYRDMWEASGFVIPASHRDNPDYWADPPLPGPCRSKYKHDQLFLCLVLLPNSDGDINIYHLQHSYQALMMTIRERNIHHDIRIALVLPECEVDQRQPIPSALYEFRNTLREMKIAVNFDGSKTAFEKNFVNFVLSETEPGVEEVHALSLKRGIALPKDIVECQIEEWIADKSSKTTPIYIKFPHWHRPGGDSLDR